MVEFLFCKHNVLGSNPNISKMYNLLFILPFLLIVCSVVICFLPNVNNATMKILAFFTSSIVFVGSLFLWVFFNQTTPKFQHSVELL